VWSFITPQLPVGDVEETQAWYRDVLGFQVGFTRGRDFGAVHCGTSEIFLARAEAPWATCVCCVRVDDVDGLFALYRERGAKIVAEPETRPWRMREFTIEDPNGHLFRIGQSTR
jgi:catechol 2,3-dioxygenase-like lactoylglutathione lyase family enzyme